MISNMKNKIPVLIGAVCALVLLGVTAKASTLNFGDSRDLGEVLFGIPSGDQDRTDYVNHLVGMTPGTSDSFSGQSFTRSLNSCCAFFVSRRTNSLEPRSGTPGKRCQRTMLKVDRAASCPMSKSRRRSRIFVSTVRGEGPIHIIPLCCRRPSLTNPTGD